MAKKVFKCVNLEESSFSELQFIVDRLSQKKSVFLKTLIHELFDVFNEFKKDSCNIFYDSVRGKVIVTVTGDSYLKLGTYPAPTLKDEAKANPIKVILPDKKSEVKSLLDKGFEKNRR